MKRKSNFELLRVIAIFFVIIIHTVSPMLYIGYPDKFTWKYSALLVSFSYTAVPIFVLLTGYFYNTKTKYTMRLKKLGLPYLFYFIFFTAYLVAAKPLNNSVLSIVGKQTLSLLSSSSGYFSGQMWYLYILFAIILFSPFFNILIERMDKNMHKRLIIILVILFFVLPTVNAFFDFNLLYIYSSTTIRLMLPVFITYYFIGAYISKYDIGIKKSTSAFVFAGSVILIFTFSMLWSTYHPIAEFVRKLTGESIIGAERLELLHQYNGYTDQFTNYYSFFVLTCAVSLFMFFRQLNIKYSKAINYLASLTYGIYLNHIFIREIINLRFPSLDGVFGIKYIILTVELIALTFVLSLMFEAVRKKLSKLAALAIDSKRNSPQTKAS